MTRDILEMVGEWARERVESGEEPPWSYFKFKQLAELTQDLAQGMASVKPYESSASALPVGGPEENIVCIETFRQGAGKQGADKQGREEPCLPV